MVQDHIWHGRGHDASIWKQLRKFWCWTIASRVANFVHGNSLLQKELCCANCSHTVNAVCHNLVLSCWVNINCFHGPKTKEMTKDRVKDRRVILDKNQFTAPPVPHRNTKNFHIGWDWNLSQMDDSLASVAATHYTDWCHLKSEAMAQLHRWIAMQNWHMEQEPKRKSLGQPAGACWDHWWHLCSCTTH